MLKLCYTKFHKMSFAKVKEKAEIKANGALDNKK